MGSRSVENEMKKMIVGPAKAGPYVLCLIVAVSISLAAQTAGWDAKYRAIPNAKNIGEYMKRMSARPHHLGSPYDKDNAEWILSKFKEWGWVIWYSSPFVSAPFGPKPPAPGSVKFVMV
jgi:hypothetical protein